MPIERNRIEEVDPHGTDQHEAGAKLDAGKLLPELVLGAFPRALEQVVKVGTQGAEKYTPNGWLAVPNGEQRYLNAAGRHRSERHKGYDLDNDSKQLHLAHEAWNLLAALELKLRKEEALSDE